MKLWLATTNTNKINEIKDFLQADFKKSLQPPSSHAKACPPPFVIQSPADLKNYRPPEETGQSFEENAEIKLKQLADFLQSENLLKSPVGILAEDSGLEVESLKGAPGIYSARYSGFQGDDKANNQLLLKNLQSHKNRRARYVCALAFLFVGRGQEKQKTFSAYCEGRIAHEERGKNGFGYDPLFIPLGESLSWGELPLSCKQKVSHRRRALAQCLGYMLEL